MLDAQFKIRVGPAGLDLIPYRFDQRTRSLPAVLE